MGGWEGISAVVLIGEERDRIVGFLEHICTSFDEYILVFDTDHADDSEELVVEFLGQNDGRCRGLDNNRFKIFHKALGKDFAALLNFGLDQATRNWVMKIDVDEVFPAPFLNNLSQLIKRMEMELPSVSVVGLPRLNTLDGKVCNDIPPEHWFSAEFENYPARPDSIDNRDIQYRLHKRDVKVDGCCARAA